jgi:DNA-binding XRE family transcriptional regulator
MRLNSEKFKRYRQNKLMSVAELAQKSEITQDTIRGLEAGKMPKMKIIRTLLTALNLTLEDSYNLGILERD